MIEWIEANFAIIVIGILLVIATLIWIVCARLKDVYYYLKSLGYTADIAVKHLDQIQNDLGDLSHRLKDVPDNVSEIMGDTSRLQEELAPTEIQLKMSSRMNDPFG